MPVSAIFENLEAGASIDDIMEWFEGLDREQMKAVIEFATRSLDKIPGNQNAQLLTASVGFELTSPAELSEPIRTVREATAFQPSNYLQQSRFRPIATFPQYKPT